MSRSCWGYRKWSASRCHCLFSCRLVVFGENMLVVCSAAEWWWWHLIMGLIWHHKVSGKHHICKSLFWCHPLLCNTTFTMIPHMTGLHFLLRNRKIWCLSKYFYILSFDLGGPHLNFGVDIIFVKVHQKHLFSRYEDISPPKYMFCMFFLHCLSCPFHKFVDMAKSALFFSILHNFVPLNDVHS